MGKSMEFLRFDATLTRGQMPEAPKPEGAKVGKQDGRQVVRNDAKAPSLPKGFDLRALATKERTVVRTPPDSRAVKIKGDAKKARVPDKDGMIEIAGRPKDDVKFLGLTIHKMSTGYKSVLGKLDAYNQDVSKVLGKGQEDYNVCHIGEGEVQRALDSLDAVDKLATKYVGGSKHGRKSEMGELKSQIHAERKLLSDLMGEIGALPGGRLPAEMSLRDAIEFARKGMSLKEAVSAFEKGETPENARALPQHPRETPSMRETAPNSNDSTTVESKQPDAPTVVKAPVSKPPMSSEMAIQYSSVGCTPSEAKLLYDHDLGPMIGKLYKTQKVPINEKTLVGDLTDAKRTGDMKRLGNGAFNTVYKGEYTRKDGSKFTGVFKQESNTPKAVGWAGGMMGIDVNDPQLGCRNIAAMNTAKLLKWNVVPDVEFGIHDGKLGIVMGLAPGKTRWGTDRVELSTAEAKKIVELKVLANFGGKLKAQAEMQWDMLEMKMGGKLVIEDGGKVFVERKVVNPVDYKNPSVRKELVKLQWLDGIDAQGDRHGGNYLVHVNDDGTAVVTGIDNDQAEGVNITDARQTKYSPDPMHEGYRGCGWPPIADEEMFTTIMGLKEEDLRSEHEGILTKPEIDAKVERLKNAKLHMAQLRKDGKIIANDAWGSSQATTLLSGKDSYVGRDTR